MIATLRAVLAPAASLVLLWALFLPAVDLSTERLGLDLRPSAVAVALVAGLAALALAGRRLGRVARWSVAALVLAAALLQGVAAVVSSTLDRPLDLYFDVPHVPSLVGLFAQGVGAGRAAAAFALAGLAALALLAAIAAAIAVGERALARRGRAIASLGATLAALAVAGVGASAGHGRAVLSFAAAEPGARLVRAAAVMSGLDHRYDAALGRPAPAGDLAALAGHDVFLVFVESYGTAVLDEPAYRAVVAPALDEFAAAVRDAGYGIRSSRLVSPVFGGGSSLAHGTLASGLRLDPFLDRLLVESRRPTLGRYFAAAGHRPVVVMPGITKPWPEASFWGFERSYFAKDLAYPGPGFGWFDIPDQYTLAQFDAAALAPGHAPLFAEIVLVSSHTPFAPVPPYVADWRDAGPYKTVSPADWRHIYRQPDWAHLERPYLDSIVYDLHTLAGWLARLPGDGLVIVLGDHQPPGLVSGATSPWTVPIHVLSRDPALLAPFARQGYSDGVLPPRTKVVKGMESFLGEFLAAFSTGAG